MMEGGTCRSERRSAIKAPVRLFPVVQCRKIARGVLVVMRGRRKALYVWALERRMSRKASRMPYPIAKQCSVIECLFFITCYSDSIGETQDEWTGENVGEMG